MERDDKAAVIVDDRQRTDGCGPALWSLEVHLPKLVRLFPFKALDRRAMTISFADKIVTQQNAMDGALRQANALTSK